MRRVVATGAPLCARAQSGGSVGSAGVGTGSFGTGPDGVCGVGEGSGVGSGMGGIGVGGWMVSMPTPDAWAVPE